MKKNKFLSLFLSVAVGMSLLSFPSFSANATSTDVTEEEQLLTTTTVLTTTGTYNTTTTSTDDTEETDAVLGFGGYEDGDTISESVGGRERLIVWVPRDVEFECSVADETIAEIVTVYETSVEDYESSYAKNRDKFYMIVDFLTEGETTLTATTSDGQIITLELVVTPLEDEYSTNDADTVLVIPTYENGGTISINEYSEFGLYAIVPNGAVLKVSVADENIAMVIRITNDHCSGEWNRYFDIETFEAGETTLTLTTSDGQVLEMNLVVKSTKVTTIETDSEATAVSTTTETTAVTESTAEQEETTDTEATEETTTTCETSLGIAFVVKTMPTKTVYEVGEELDLTGLTFDNLLTLINGDYVMWMDGFNVSYTEFEIDASEFDSSIPGTYTIYATSYVDETDMYGGHYTGSATTSFEVTVVEQEADSGIIGDVNLDGKVNLADVIRLNRYVAGVVDFSDLAYSNADTNTDGYVDADDALVLLKFQVGLINSLPA